jgi:antitoxin MazE
MTSVVVGKWGRNLAVRFPGEIASALGLKDGERVEVEAEDDRIVIRRAAPRYSLAKLFEGKTPQEWREAYAGAFDWGPDLGREIVEE